MDSLLVIDDDPTIANTIKEALETGDLLVATATSAQQGQELLRSLEPLVVLLDLRLGKDSGIQLFEELKKLSSSPMTIFITGHGTSESAIDTIKRGAFDYLSKPLDLGKLREVTQKALRIARMSRSQVAKDGCQEGESGAAQIIGSSLAIQDICKQIGRIAPQNVNVLILGESGTGKELIAHSIVQHSRRNDKPFLAINCAAIPEPLLESELFGHEQGAFTGAERRRIGKFEQCHGGTIFLDEVGDMSLSTQAKILRLLQDGQYQRLGGNESLASDVRIVAATNQNLEALIRAGRFRQDLFYRLRGITIKIPPLRERKEDIPELAHYFLFRFNRELGTDIRSIAPEAIERLQDYPWPGNIRELQGTIREAMILSVGPTLLVDFLPLEVGSDRPAEFDPKQWGPLRQDGWMELGSSFNNGSQVDPMTSTAKPSWNLTVWSSARRCKKRMAFKVGPPKSSD